MFVQADRRIPLRWELARQGLDRALDADGLVPESRHAESSAQTFVMPVGPRGSRGPARDVVVSVLSPTTHGECVSIPLRWETRGPTGSLFPTLDGDLRLSSADPQSSTLSITARYDPPLGAIGAVVDKTIMTKVAVATMNALLGEIEERIQRMSAEDGVV